MLQRRRRRFDDNSRRVATMFDDTFVRAWITPQAIDDLQLDAPEYGDGRTLQPITARW
jgi:hypothetical protein